MNSFNIAAFGDTHIGNMAYSRTTPQGINIRVQDGYDALHAITGQIVNSDVPIHAAVHTGDMFHTSQPSMRDIKTVQYYLRELSKKGIPFYGIAGNHDVTDNRSMMAAVAPMDDPDRGIHALYNPYQVYDISKKDGIFLHSVSHHGLSSEEAPKISPVADGINLFTTHGSAIDPKNATLMNCEGPREQIIPPDMILDDNFAAKILGHYHTRYAVGGPELNTYYTGSTFRRGFSDEPGPRGWMLIRVFPDGTVTFENKDIKQRPQYDLPVIDAANITGSDLQELIHTNLLSTRKDEKDNQFDLKNAPIVRQRVINSNRGMRQSVDKLYIAQVLASHTLEWKLEYENDAIDYNANMAKVEGKSSPSLSKKSAKSDVKAHFNDWIEGSQRLAELAENARSKVTTDSLRHLTKNSNS